MKAIKLDLWICILLIVILCFCGFQFSSAAKGLSKRSKTEEYVTVGSDQKTVFEGEAGVDIWGRSVHPLPSSLSTRTIAFMLRGNNIKKDISFWRQVEILLPREAKLRLVAYCDGDGCAEAVRQLSVIPPFPVIAYGEITSSQAVTNADVDGNAILRDERWLVPKTVAWRGAGLTPNNLIREVSK